jgi:predicted flap endonuclease-1-like 5' DNA nuclease
MSVWVLVLLAVLVGVALGTLVVLYLDMRSWGARLQTAVAERKAVQKTLTQAQKSLAQKHGQLQQAQRQQAILQDEVEEQTRRLTEESATNEALNQALLAAQQQMDEWQTAVAQHARALAESALENQVLLDQQKLAHGELLRLQEEVDQHVQEITRLRQENQEVGHQLAVLEVEVRHLRQDAAEAEAWQVRAESAIAEKESYKDQLNEAQVRNGELNAQLTLVIQQLKETEHLRNHQTTSEKRLAEASEQIETLQEKLNDVQGQMSYSGKNQLRIIRGIGPAYARRLNEFGILTLADLAKATPEEVREILKVKKWQSVDVERWIEEAKALALRFPDEA